MEGEEFQEIDLNSETELLTEDKASEMRIKYWLLDAAISQFTPLRSFLSKRRFYLPDSVFYAPGIEEEDLLHFLTIRGASKRCIRYAMLKFNEARENDSSVEEDSFSDSTGRDSDETVLTDSGNGSDDKQRRSALNYFRVSWKRLKRIFKRNSE